MKHHEPDAPYSLHQALLLFFVLASVALLCNALRVLPTLQTLFTGGAK